MPTRASYSLRFSDLENIQSPVGSFSQTFTIPKTNDTDQAFGQIEHPGYLPFNDEQTGLRSLFLSKSTQRLWVLLCPKSLDTFR